MSATGPGYVVGQPPVTRPPLCLWNYTWVLPLRPFFIRGNIQFNLGDGEYGYNTQNFGTYGNNPYANNGPNPPGPGPVNNNFQASPSGNPPPTDNNPTPASPPGPGANTFGSTNGNPLGGSWNPPPPPPNTNNNAGGSFNPPSANSFATNGRNPPGTQAGMPSILRNSDSWEMLWGYLGMILDRLFA